MFREVKTVAAMYAYSRITEFDDAMYARSRVADLIDSVDLFRCFVVSFSFDRRVFISFTIVFSLSLVY